MIWLFDNGHGGMVGAKYLTKGKRSPEVVPGLGVYEGEFNRDIVKRVVGQLRTFGIYAFDIVPEAKNVKLAERIRRANDYYTSPTHPSALCNPHVRLISIHANASKGAGWTDGNGLVVFHYPGSTKGRRLALNAQQTIMNHVTIKSRGIKTARFAMLRRTRMPAILVEHGFMTNKGDARKLASDKFRTQVADAYVQMILRIENDS